MNRVFMTGSAEQISRLCNSSNATLVPLYNRETRSAEKVGTCCRTSDVAGAVIGLRLREALERTPRALRGPMRGFEDSAPATHRLDRNLAAVIQLGTLFDAFAQWGVSPLLRNGGCSDS